MNCVTRYLRPGLAAAAALYLLSACSGSSGPTSCEVAANGSCVDFGYAFCGDTCCPGDYPYYCAATANCYATEQGALDACGHASCVSCKPDAGLCDVPTLGPCENPSNHASCGDAGCCTVGTTRYFCASTSTCYGLATSAANDCGSACVECGTATNAVHGTCAVNTSTTMCAAGTFACGDHCCPAWSRYYCASTGGCYPTEAAANVACGTSCTFCGPSCTPSAGGSCATSGYSFCGSSSCCPPGSPYFCSSTSECYPTSDGAAAACGSACVECAAP
jgi:hypothetical protein